VAKDLSSMTVAEAERQLGHVLRSALLHSHSGVLVLSTGDSQLRFLPAEDILRAVPLDVLASALFYLGLSEEEARFVLTSIENQES
jgi:hypothetical protein